VKSIGNFRIKDLPRLPPAGKETGMSHLRGIAFESDETQLSKLRERLRKMSDDELIAFGRLDRGLSAPRVGVTRDPWKAQLQEARAEWGTLVSCEKRRFEDHKRKGLDHQNGGGWRTITEALTGPKETA
jgi:hypothetical protein